MEKLTNLIASNVVVQAVLFILFGFLLAFWPQTTTITVVYILAACIALSGVASLISYARGRSKGAGSQGTLLLGLFLVIIAIIMAAIPQAVAGLISILLGAILILSGLLNVVRSIALKDFGGGLWVVMFIFSLLIVAGGVVIIVNPFATVVMFVLVLGILLIAKGVIDLIVHFATTRSEKLPHNQYSKE